MTYGRDTMKYRKKPVEVEAEVYREGMEDGWMVYEDDGMGGSQYWASNDEINDINTDIQEKAYPGIKTLEGWLKISERDYIITGVKGERYPCKPDIFEQTYEKIGEMELKHREFMNEEFPPDHPIMKLYRGETSGQVFKRV
jgi:hypothetical protein